MPSVVFLIQKKKRGRKSGSFSNNVATELFDKTDPISRKVDWQSDFHSSGGVN